MKLRKALILLVICVLSLTAFACGTDSGSSSSTPDDSQPAVVEITLSKTDVTLIVGQEETITATVNGTDEAPVWASSNDGVATVSGGKITAISAGTAQVSATIGEVSAVANVRVKNPVTMSVDKEEITINPVDWTDSKGTVFGKTSEKITAALEVNGTAVEAEVTYKSLKTSIATVEADGTVTAVAIGSTTIEASAVYEGETYKTTVKVTVKKVDIDSIEAFTFGGDKNEWVIDVSRFGLEPADVTGIFYKESGDDYVQVDEYGDIVFEGNNAKVITDGINVEEKTEADVIVLETENLSITIRIAYVNSKNITFVSENSPMVIGASKQYKLYANGIEVSESAEWSVNKEYIATVSDDGTITAVSYGTVVVTAKVYGYTYTTTQTVLKEQEVPDDKSVEVGVKNYSIGVEVSGWRIDTHNEYFAGDWVSFTFTPVVDLTGHQLYVYYGLNNLESEFDLNFPKGVAYVFMGCKEASANIFTDSSFIVLNGKGEQIGSIAGKKGVGSYKAGETYTVYVQIPDDGSDDHDIFIKFSSERHLEASQVMKGVLSWRDNLDNLDPMIYPQNSKAFVLSGETKKETVTLNKTLTFNASELATKNTIDLAELGIDGEVVAVNVEGLPRNRDYFAKDENGIPVVENGKLKLLNDFYTKAGTKGVKTFEIDLNEKRYVLNIEIVPIYEECNNGEVLLNRKVDKVFISAKDMVDAINAGKKYLAFDFYASEISDSAYLYMQIGARHIHLKANQAWIHSTWDNSRQDKLTADFVKVFDEDGVLVTDTLTWGGNKMYGSVENSMQAGKWYKVFFDMDGRAWGDDICLNPGYAAAAAVMAKTVGMNAYIANVTVCSPAELSGISLNKNEITIADDGEEALIVTLSSILQGTKVTYKSSNESVATVSEDGVVTAHKAGVAIITATAMGKEATCTVNVVSNLAEQEGSRVKLTTGMVSWLPGTFDKQIAFDGFSSNANVNPAYIPGEDFGSLNMLEFNVTFKADAPAGYLHVYEYEGRDSAAWAPNTVAWTVIGKDTYTAGTHSNVSAPVAAFNELRIYDVTDGNKDYRESAIEWKAGHTYKILVVLHGNNSIGFWYTSSVLNGDAGTYGNWHIPTYAYDVLSIIEFGDIYGAYVAGGSTIALTAETGTVRIGEPLQLNASVSGITDKTVTYASSNKDVATVSETGLVNGVATGTAIITATNAEGKTASIEITVKTASDDVEVVYMIANKQFKKETVKNGEIASAPVAPQFAGYNFAGWYNGETAFDFGAPVTADYVLTAKYEMNGDSSFLCENRFTGAPIEYFLNDGNAVVAAHAAGTDYLTFKFTAFTDINGTDDFLYLQVGARHIGIGSNDSWIMSYWDNANLGAMPADAVSIYDEEGKLVRDKLTWFANGSGIAGGTVMSGSVDGVIEAGKTYTVVINMNCRAWDDAFMNVSFDAPGGIVAGLASAGVFVQSVGGYYTVEYVGLSATK